MDKNAINMRLYDHEDEKLLPKPYDPAYISADPYKLYNKNSIRSDVEFMEDCNETMDSLLVFAGLFSAVTTALIVETYKDLRPRPEARTEQLLGAMLERLGNSSAPTRIEDIHPIPFFPPYYAVVTNITFFLSLSISLLAALFALLVKQWTRKVYGGLRVIVSPRRLAREHYERMKGMNDWNLPAIIAAIPIMLHISLFLFFTGLIYWLGSLNSKLYTTILVIACVAAGFYCAAAVIPSIRPNAPFRWPVSAGILWATNWIKEVVVPEKSLLPTSISLSLSLPFKSRHAPHDKPGIIYTPLRRKSPIDEELFDVARDRTDMEIMLNVLNHAETTDGIEGIIDIFRRALIDTQRTKMNKVLLGEQLITFTIHKAAQAALACQVYEEGSYHILPDRVDRLTILMEFFEVALQRVSFDEPKRAAILDPLLQISTLLLTRAIEAQSLDEVALNASIVVQLQYRFGQHSHISDAIPVIDALRDHGPIPRSWRDRHLDEDDRYTRPLWSEEEIRWYQRLILPYFSVLPRLVKSLYESGKDLTPEEESRLSVIADKIRGLLFVAQVRDTTVLDNWEDLRKAFVAIWQDSSGSPPAFHVWMKTVMLRAGIEGIVTPEGDLGVSYG
ncbi:hypothetical protein FRC18_008160 [Serendipita sp. 400]|nr:hypothetical protein FRC18_008160 [Serendipita sp. 400]